MAASDTGIEVGLARGTTDCQGRYPRKKYKCQDINGNGCSGDDTGAAGGGRKTQHKHCHCSSKHDLHLFQDEDACYKMVPPDGGWGWMVVLGTFIIATLLPALGPCFGVLFSGYLLGTGSSSTTTAWIFNMQCFLWFSSGILTRPLTQEFGWRPVALGGSVTCCLGLMLSAFTPNPSFLFFSYSIMTGFGGGLVTCQCFTILPHYFQRRRGLTNAIMMSGICLGQIVAPPVSRYLENDFGYRGATLILGAAMLHSCIGASFFQPYEWHQKMVMVEEEPMEDVPPLPTKSKSVGSPQPTCRVTHSPSQSSFVGTTTEAEWDSGLAVKARLLERVNGLKTSTSSSRQPSRYNSTLSLSSMDLGSVAVLPMNHEQEMADMEAQKEQGDILLIRVVKSIIKDLSVLKSFRACIICFCAIMCLNGFLNFIMMVPFSMAEAGFSKETAAWGVSLCSGLNLVTRFIVSFLSDFPRFNKRLTYQFGFVLIASSIMAFTLVTSEEWLLAVMGVYGVGVGASMGIYNIVIIDVMGVEHLPAVYGSASFSVAVGFIFIGPLIGFIRDVTQSYSVSMRITAGMLLLAAVAWIFIGVAERIDLRREEAKKMKKEPQVA